MDFEFAAPDGGPPEPLCMVARRIEDGRTLRLRREELRALQTAPFATDADVLFVAFYASAEAGCFLALGWPTPINVLDLFADRYSYRDRVRFPGDATEYAGGLSFTHDMGVVEGASSAINQIDDLVAS